MKQPKAVCASLTQNLAELAAQFGTSTDYTVRKIVCGETDCAVVLLDGLCNTQYFVQGVLRPILTYEAFPPLAEDLLKTLTASVIPLSEVAECTDWATLCRKLCSGCCVILADGVAVALTVGVQGLPQRSIDEPSNETVQRGSREGFVEVLRKNLAMVRRRLKTPDLQFELFTVGRKSKTDVALCYLQSAVSPKLLQEVRRRLKSCPLETVLESGYLQPYLEDRPRSLFSGVGVSERPDTVCGKITEGRIAVFVDGTPMVLIVPYLFIEHFHSFDDYAERPYFAAFTRFLKLLAFLTAILLPGFYVAAGTFHPVLFPDSMLYHLAAAENNQPFSLMTEALLIHIIYELMREAGLRLPKPIGHAVGIIGGLVIGDAAVAAGIIGTPMLMIVALTALSSFVIPQLYEPVVILRLGFIVLGGLGGVPAVLLAFCALLVNLCAVNPFGVPFTAPIAPFKPQGLRDAFWRRGWQILQKRTARIDRFSEEENR